MLWSWTVFKKLVRTIVHPESDESLSHLEVDNAIESRVASSELKKARKCYEDTLTSVVRSLSEVNEKIARGTNAQ